MTKSEKAIRRAQDLVAEVAPNRSADLVGAMRGKAAQWSALAQSNLIDARDRFAHRSHPRPRADEIAGLLRARAARLASTARGGQHHGKSNRAGPALAIAGVAGGVLLGLAVAELMRRKRLRAREADVGTYFSHEDEAPAGEPMFERPEDAYLAQGAGFEDPTGGEPASTPITPTRQ